MSKIIRITLFKLPDRTVVQEAIQDYSKLKVDAKKGGKPYILTAAAHAAYEDPRSQGYTLVARTVFESKEDMDFYDEDCEAHAAIKAKFKPLAAGPPLVIYMDAQSEQIEA